MNEGIPAEVGGPIFAGRIPGSASVDARRVGEVTTMVHPTIEAVTERLDGLERENHRLRWIAGALIVGVLGLGAMAICARDRVGRTLEAQRLVLRDKEGRLRGSFGVDGIGLPSLKLYDHRGLEQIALGIQSEDMSSLTLSDRGATRVLLETSVGGSTALRLFDSSEREQATLFLNPDCESGFRIAYGTQVMTMGLGPDGRMTVLTTDASGRQVDRLVPAGSATGATDVTAQGSPVAPASVAEGRTSPPPGQMNTGMEIEGRHAMRGAAL